MPDTIGQLTQLTELWLTWNKLTSLPNTIGQLTQLTKLILSNNELISLPDTIRHLTQLKILLLAKNKFTNLPLTIGYLTLLERLDVSSNEFLQELPMSLGQLSNLRELGIQHTHIPQEQVNPILAACQAVREDQAEKTLDAHLKLWIQTNGQKDIDFSQLINILKKGQKVTLNDWLFRLEKKKILTDVNTNSQK